MVSTIHPCGCLTDIDPGSGVIRSYEKCEFHRREREAQPEGEVYYRSIGVLDDKGDVRVDHYVAELLEGIGEIPKPAQSVHRHLNKALEIGCGVSPYVRAIEAAGYSYTGIEPDVWAANETATRFNVSATRFNVSVLCDWFTPKSFGPESFRLILAAHVIEHLPHAPDAIRGMSGMLSPGGHAVIVVPDDTDLVNPDHNWFFNEESLYMTLRLNRLDVVRMSVLKRIERENFIYCVAKKRD